MTIDTDRFGWGTTAEEAAAGLDLRGIRAVVTGGSSGIGAETARVLASVGAQVTLAVRNIHEGRRVADRITAEQDGVVHVAHLDLADPSSTRAFAGAWSGPLHLLINNAGVMALPQRTLNAGGHELQFATNHLGHFVLATALHAALTTGAEDATAQRSLGGARVVSLSSRGHLRATVDFDDIDFEHRPYDAMIAYGQSKTANVLFAVGAAQRWSEEGITANAVHPGAILETNLGRHIPADLAGAIAAANKQQYKTTAQGAATTILVATAPTFAGVSGRYFEDCHESEVLGRELDDLAAHPAGVAWYALDQGNADRLWDLSEQLTT
ncbi:MAG TPA: SDR family NAD(P)-dependent oxidoreductase [Jatrophihabitans sp.]|jgi:NAD(P)-dependent dehydrogenase (short-subunit alcohol dehydrogenase family)